MNQNEFYKLTGVEVSEREYWCINEVYNNSDLNKYDFCKMWCKMNKQRVESAKIYAKERAAKERNIDEMFKILERLMVVRRTFGQWEKTLSDVLTEKQLQCLRTNGIAVEHSEGTRLVGWAYSQIWDKCLELVMQK